MIPFTDIDIEYCMKNAFNVEFISLQIGLAAALYK